MNLQSLSRTAVLLALVLSAACHKREPVLLTVQPDTYKSKACWFDDKGVFANFLVFGKRNNIGVPYFISAKCSPEERGMNYGSEIISNLTALYFADQNGILQKKFPNMTVSDNIKTDQPTPNSASELYYVRAELAVVNRGGVLVYVPKKIDYVIDTGATLLTLFEMAPAERSRFVRRFRK